MFSRFLKIIFVGLCIGFTHGATSQTIHINGVDLAYSDSKKGTVAVLFESGFGTDQNTWQAVTNLLSPAIRQITYSRAGLGKSSSAVQPRTISQHVDDLDAFLQYLNLDIPIIIVGHSYGGLIASELVRKHPNQVQGLVLIDPATMQQRRHFNTVDKHRVAEDDKMLMQYMPQQLVADYQLLVKQLESAPKSWFPLPSKLPAHILTAIQPSKCAFVFSETPKGKEIWSQLHKSLISDAENHKQAMLDTSSHNIHHEFPALVVSHINQVINKI